MRFLILYLTAALLTILCDSSWGVAIFSISSGSSKLQLLRDRYLGWKIPRPSPGSVRIRPMSTVGNVRRSEVSNRRPLRPSPYVVEFPIGINPLHLSDNNEIDAPEPPPHQEVAKMARFIVSQSIWTPLSTISTRNETKGSPFSTILSVSDGTIGNSTGVPYFYLTAKDTAVKDLEENPAASVVMTLAEGHYCLTKKLDPEDPRCAMVSLQGRIVKVPIGSAEEAFGRSAMFFKHPVMKTWPESHHWFVAKMELESILVRDYFGGIKKVDLEDYFAVNPNRTNPNE